MFPDTDAPTHTGTSPRPPGTRDDPSAEGKTSTNPGSSGGNARQLSQRPDISDPPAREVSLTAATELILTALELPDVQRSLFPYVPPIVGTIGSGETPAATAWATVRTSAR